MNEADRKAWGAFWAQRRPGGGSGCLPQGSAGIDKAQQRVWHDVAGRVAPGGRVLDIATGDARVLRWLKKVRPDLKLTGVDAAPILPPPPQGCTVKPGVAMECLPFADTSFDLVTSQFGFEYGDTATAAAEIARVLKPRGNVALMLHRGDGPILAHNLARRKALHWAVEDQKVLDVARQAVMLPGTGRLIAGKLGIIAAEGARQFGAQSPAWEVPEAARQTVVLGLQRHPANVSAALAALEELARDELARIASLERACAVAEAREQMLGALQKVGLVERTTQPIRDFTGCAIADLIWLNS